MVRALHQERLAGWPAPLQRRHNDHKASESEQPLPSPAVRVQYRQGQNDEQQERERPDQTRHQCPAVKADFPKSPERRHHESASIDPGAEQLALRDRQASDDQRKSGEEIVPRATDSNQLGATQGENDADQSDDAAKDPDRPFGSAGWLSPIAKEDDVLQLTEHGNFPLAEPTPPELDCENSRDFLAASSAHLYQNEGLRPLSANSGLGT